MGDDLAGAIIGLVIHAAAAGVAAAATNESSANARRRKEARTANARRRKEARRYHVNENNHKVYTMSPRARPQSHANQLKPKRIVKPVVKTNLFANEEPRIDRKGPPPGTVIDMKTLRGKLTHNPIPKTWQCQPTFIIHRGFMSKAGVINSSYKERFFVLTSKRQLHYYKCTRSEVSAIASEDYIRKSSWRYEKGLIRLEDFHSIECRNTYEFRLVSKDKTGRDFLFRCENLRDAQVWNLLIRATTAGMVDPWQAVNPKRENVDDEKIDDIDPMKSSSFSKSVGPELVHSTYQGPGFGPEPSAPEEGLFTQGECIDLAPSAPLAIGEPEFATSEPEQIEGKRTEPGACS